ncbi:MAG: putative 2-dehydropantoate 2-reductase [Merismopedia sp. SIO2A8]|nr:putative 2-dehydropantoate 2-reductase [Symploca sp. SIO2B6]NET53034.1 putative 2-dehydropantoate 2-reductase [Merismopedia sp. SIO2A8]
MINFSYTIVGTGAIGGFYGSRLQQAGGKVNFLLNSDYQYVSHNGLLVESPEGNFTLPQVNAYRDVSEIPPSDVVVVALKTTNNHLLSKLLPPLIKDTTIVLVLQNGLGIEEEVAKIVGTQRVIGGMCFICSNKIGPGHIRHLDYGTVTIAEYLPNYQPVGITQKMRQLAADFESAGIEVLLSEDLLLSRWQKLVWNIPYNGLSVVLDATTEQLMADEEMRSLIEQIMQEVVLGAKTCNRLIPESFIEKMLVYTTKMKPYRTSMKIDYDLVRPLEIEAIFSNPLKIVAQAGVDLPRIRMLDQQLKFLNTNNRSNNSLGKGTNC